MDKRRTDFGRFHAAVSRRGMPDRVPLAEVGVDIEVMESFLGTPIADLKTYVSFWEKAGYDYVLLQVRGQPLPDAVQIKITEGQLRWTRHTGSAPTFGLSTISNEASFEAYPWIGSQDVYYQDVDSIRQFLPESMKLVVSHGPIFQSVFRMMGLESMSVAAVENPALIEAIADKVGQLSVSIIRNLAQRDWVGGIWFGDDMAYTHGLFVSPDFLRRYVFPFYRQMGDLCRQYEKLFILHSDGDLTQVFEDLIGCGYQAVHPNEPSSVDILELKRRWGDRLAFIGNIDMDLLVRGTPEQIIDATKYLIDNVAPGGGFALGSGNSIANYIPLENYKAMLETAAEYG